MAFLPEIRKNGVYKISYQQFQPFIFELMPL
jgi:hypothetical protein